LGFKHPKKEDYNKIRCRSRFAGNLRGQQEDMEVGKEHVALGEHIVTPLPSMMEAEESLETDIDSTDPDVMLKNICKQAELPFELSPDYWNYFRMLTVQPFIDQNLEEAFQAHGTVLRIVTYVLMSLLTGVALIQEGLLKIVFPHEALSIEKSAFSLVFVGGMFIILTIAIAQIGFRTMTKHQCWRWFGEVMLTCIALR